MEQAEAPGAFPCVDSQVLSFTGSDLQDVFQQLDVNNGGDGDAMNDYVARPRKRLRLSSGTMTATSTTIYESIVGRVYQLLGSQNASDLDGLHLVAT